MSMFFGGWVHVRSDDFLKQKQMKKRENFLSPKAECGDFVVEDYPDHTYLSTFKFVPGQVRI